MDTSVAVAMVQSIMYYGLRPAYYDLTGPCDDDDDDGHLPNHSEDEDGQYTVTYSLASESKGVCHNAYCPPSLPYLAEDLTYLR